MFGKPYDVAHLSTDPSDNVFFNDVVSFAHGEKKRRPEIVLGIDGQGVNIFDITNSRMVTSYLFSPQSKLSGPPFSIRYRSSARRGEHRYTYCSIQSPQPRILCFHEENTPGQSVQEISTSELGLDTVIPIVCIDLLPDRSNAENLTPKAVVLVQQDGGIRCCDARLEGTLWHTKLAGNVSSNAQHIRHVVSANIISQKQASKNMLRQVEGLLDRKSGDDELASFLLVLHQTDSGIQNAKSDLMASFYVFPDTPKGNARPAAGFALNAVVSRPVHLPNNFTLEQDVISFHAGSATLSLSRPGETIVYSLEDLCPRLVYRVSCTAEEIPSFIYMNKSSVAVSAKQEITLIGLPYGSRQATIGIESSQKAPFQKSPDMITTHSDHHIQLRSYSKQHNILIAQNGSRFIAIPLLQNRLGKRDRQGSLIAALGCNATGSQSNVAIIVSSSTSSALGPSPNGSPLNAEWSQEEITLDEFVKTGCYEQFDDTMNKELVQSGPEARKRHQISFVLSRIFKAHIDDEKVIGRSEGQPPTVNRLDIVFWPSQTVRRILQQGFLNTTALSSALKEHKLIPANAIIDMGVLVHAVARQDQSLSLLREYISHTALIDATEISHTFSLVGRRMRQLRSSLMPQRLLEAEAPDNEDVSSNGVIDLHPNHADQEDQTFSDVAEAQDFLYDVMARLKAVSTWEVPSAMRQVIPTSELRYLVDILRIEMSTGGWLSYATDEFATPTHGKGADRITLIAHTLNLLLDALGATGWMQGQRNSDIFDQTSNTISYMRAEVSAALEGIEEATYLRQMLGEVLICGKKALNSSKDSEGLANQLSLNQPASVTKTSVLSKASLLPLGLKLGASIPRQKVGAGGEIIQRSRRDIGRLKSKKVGKYSFERIEI